MAPLILLIVDDDGGEPILPLSEMMAEVARLLRPERMTPDALDFVVRGASGVYDSPRHAVARARAAHLN